MHFCSSFARAPRWYTCYMLIILSSQLLAPSFCKIPSRLSGNLPWRTWDFSTTSSTSQWNENLVSSSYISALYVGYSFSSLGYRLQTLHHTCGSLGQACCQTPVLLWHLEFCRQSGTLQYLTFTKSDIAYMLFNRSISTCMILGSLTWRR